MNFLKLILLLFLIGFIVLVLFKKSNRNDQSSDYFPGIDFTYL
jgi:hypothetical protein